MSTATGRVLSELVLADLVELRAEKQPDLDVLTFEHMSLDGAETPDEVRSFADLHANAHRIAGALVANGVGPGDRFAVMMRNHPEFVEAVIAASITCSVFVPVDPRTRADKLAFMLGNAGCSGIICTDGCLGEVEKALDSVPQVKWVLLLDTGGDSGVFRARARLQPLREVLENPARTLDPRGATPETPLQIMFTSGTTGDPKGIVGVNYRFCAAGILGAIFGYAAEDRPYSGLSLTHGNAQSVTLAPALVMSLRAVFSRRFTKSKLWDVCRRYGCTTFSLVGGMATAVYSEPPRSDDPDNPVRLVVSGGMPPAIWEDFEKRFAVDILEFYGAMDGGGMAYNPPRVGPVGSFGKSTPDIEMKILDEDGNECAPGVVGEICTRPADGKPAGVDYYGNREASEKKIRRGWNHSGDMGHRDKDGWLYFDYRAGGGIRHNGDFVNSSFVEKALAEHPAVSDVFVYGVTAASGAPGEKDVVAAVVPMPGSKFSPEELFAHCRARLEPNFVPCYLQVVDEIPKTASEKPQERLLAQRFSSRRNEVYTAQG